MYKSMILLILIVLSSGCSRDLELDNVSEGSEITHDYIIENALEICKNHQGLHYIVTKTKWLRNDEHDRHPCDQKYVVSCQDGYKQVLYSETKYCFISKMQIDRVKEY